jgi:serine/threonine-protein kinase
MAPERFYFQSSIASDLYAVGVIFYELLVGDRPFSGSYNQLMVAHLNHTVQLPDDLPQAVRSLLFKALEKLAARRFHTATAMKVALLEARQSLTATDLREQYPKPYRDTTCSVFQPRQPLRLPTASEQLAVVSWSPDRQGVLSASEQVVQGWDITNSTVAPITSLSLQWQLPGRVEQILPVCWGAIAITQQTLYHLLPDQPPKPLVKLPVPLQMEIAHQRWCLVQAESATKTTFWLVDVLGKVPTTPRSFVLPPPKGTYQSLLLDQRHILVADCQEQTTYLHILTRWGKFLGTLYLQARVHRLFPSHRPLQVLAQVGAKRQDLLIIRIKPFRVMRCRLDHLFGWVGELVIGYAIASPTGELQMINYHGQAIGNIKGLPIPAEIAFQAPYHLWLTSNETQTPVLHHIDIRDLALDIVF